MIGAQVAVAPASPPNLPPITVTPEQAEPIVRQAASRAESEATLASGDVLAVWRQGPEIFAQFRTGEFAAAKPYRVVKDAWPGCEPRIAPLLDGGAVVLYVAAAEAPEHRQIQALKLHGRRWLKEGKLILGTSTPSTTASASRTPFVLRFAVDGGRVALVWNEPGDRGGGHLYASYSSDAGARFIRPIEVGPALDGDRALDGAGTAADIALLHDSAAVVSWTQGGSAGLRRLTPEWYANPVTAVPLPAGIHAAGTPLLSLRHDYAGAADRASLELEITTTTGVCAFAIDVPEADLLAAAAEDCHCAPSPQQLLGFPVRGTVTAVDIARHTVTLDLDAVPGVMDPGLHTFAIDSSAPRLRRGDECIGRIELATEAAWRLFDIKPLGN